MTRLIALIIAGVAAFALTAPAADGRAPKRSDFRFVMPQPGDVSLLAVSFKVTAKRAAALPRRVDVRVAGRRKLPSDVRLLTATRLDRAGRTTKISLLVFAVRKAGGPPTARAAQESQEPLVDLLVYGPHVKCPRCKRPVPEHTVIKGHCEDCQNTSSAFKAYKLPSLTQPADGLFEKVKDGVIKDFMDFSGGGGENGATVDPNLDTGHYDDGHAFGWGVKTQADTDEAVANGIANIWKVRPAAIVPTLETDVAADLNGDGVIGPGEGRIDTTVGPPVITGGEPQPTP